MTQAPSSMHVDMTKEQTAIETTEIGGGLRVPKDHPRLEASGCVDELNTFVGAVRTGLHLDGEVSESLRARLEPELRAIQNRLFDLGRVLGKAEGGEFPLPGDAETRALEQSMDAMQKLLKPLNSFVLPGGTPTNARLHMCRAVCHRAERRAVALRRDETVPHGVIRYLNSLSDWFLTAARLVALSAGKREWEYELKGEAGG